MLTFFLIYVLDNTKIAQNISGCKHKNHACHLLLLLFYVPGGQRKGIFTFLLNCKTGIVAS